jgi:hypothetical protein
MLQLVIVGFLLEIICDSWEIEKKYSAGTTPGKKVI